MGRKRRRGKNRIHKSVHERTLEELRIARLERISVPVVKSRELEEDNKSNDIEKHYVHTFNWDTDGGFFNPVLVDGEFPDKSSPIRELINITAKGEETPSDLREALMGEPSEKIYEAIKEGIHRWHGPGKEIM